MSDHDEKRLRRLLLLSWFLVILLLIGIVAFFSYKIGTSDSYAASTRQVVVSNSEDIRKLQKTIADLAKRPAAPVVQVERDKDGRDGKDSVSTHTITEKQVIEKQPIKGDPFRFEDFTPEQLASLKGQDARQPILCKLSGGMIGWRFLDSTICMEIEP